MAHLHLGLLAYWVVNTIRYQLKQKGIKTNGGYFRIMNTQKIVTTTMNNEYDQQIIIRQCSEPPKKYQNYTALQYKSKHLPAEICSPLPELKRIKHFKNLNFFRLLQLVKCFLFYTH